MQEQDTQLNSWPTQTTENKDNEQKPKESFGAIAGILIIVILLLLGGMYFWGAYLQKALGINLPNTENTKVKTDTGFGDIPTKRASFEPTAPPIVDNNYTEIDTFIDNTDNFNDLDNIDKDLQNIGSGL